MAYDPMATKNPDNDATIAIAEIFESMANWKELTGIQQELSLIKVFEDDRNMAGLFCKGLCCTSFPLALSVFQKLITPMKLVGTIHMNMAQWFSVNVEDVIKKPTATSHVQFKTLPIQAIASINTLASAYEALLRFCNTESEHGGAVVSYTSLLKEYESQEEDLDSAASGKAGSDQDVVHSLNATVVIWLKESLAESLPKFKEQLYVTYDKALHSVMGRCAEVGAAIQKAYDELAEGTWPIYGPTGGAGLNNMLSQCQVSHKIVNQTIP